METFPFKKIIITLIVIMAIVAGVGLYLGANESASATALPTTPRKILIIAVNGSGTTSPTVGEYEYLAGETIAIIATPDNDWQFDNWYGNVTNLNSDSTMVFMDADKTITANFSKIPKTAPQMTLEEQAYRTTIENRISIIGQALNSLDVLIADQQIEDTQWTVKVVVQFALIQAIYDDAIVTDFPDSMAHIHAKYMQAMEHYETATQLITQGVQKLDVSLLNQITEEIDTGTQLLTEAIELLNEFTKAHSPLNKNIGS